MEKYQFSVNELISERLEWAAPQIVAAGVVVQVNAVREFTLMADRDRIGQALSILIDNLLRYAAQGRHCEVTASQFDGAFFLVVADRGPGVKEDQLSRMFDRFWRAESSRARPWGGTGLGLSIASAICEAHGGNISASNRDGGGLAIQISIPALN
jgi:signal transduction histidine kinase